MTKPQLKNQPWHTASTGKRSAMSLLWNKYRNVDEIAKRICVDAKIITAFLASRPGYPGPVLQAKNKKREPRPTLKEMGIPPATPQQRPITLPRVRILEKSYDWLDGP